MRAALPRGASLLRGPGSRLLRALLPLAALALVLLALPRAAHAVGSVRVEQTKVEESDGRWKLKMTIDLGKVPDINYIPMMFSFTPTMLYERSLTDESPEKPVIIKKPLSNQQAINESMDVGFSDGTGKAFKVTKFNFMVRRDRGFEAGEYTLEIRRTSDNALIGNKIRLVLDGENPVVDRRAISFVGDTGKKKKKDEPKDEPKPDADAAADPAGDAPVDEPVDSAADPDIAPDGPDPVPPKQGGCGCELAGTPSPSRGAALLILPLAAAVLRRRRRRAA